MRIYANNNDCNANLCVRVRYLRSEAKLWFSHVKRREFACEVKRSEYLFTKTILAKQMRIFIREIYPSEANMRKKSHPDRRERNICSALRFENLAKADPCLRLLIWSNGRPWLFAPSLSLSTLDITSFRILRSLASVASYTRFFGSLKKNCHAI